MIDLPLNVNDEFRTLPAFASRPLEAAGGFSPQSNDSDEFRKDEASFSSLSLLMIFVLTFCCLTGFLLGYDLCVVSTILGPIKDDFDLCPTQTIQPSLFYTTDDLFTDDPGNNNNAENTNDPRHGSNPANSNRSLKNNVTSASRNLANIAPIASSAPKHRRRLQPSPCIVNRQREFHLRLLGVDRPSLDKDTNSASGFKSCSSGQLFVSIISPGAALGSLLSGPFADSAGRILTLALADLLIMVGTLLMSFCSSFYLLFVGRFILGIGIGVGFVIFSTYVTECAPENWRGRMVSSIEVAQCVGCLTSFAATAVIGNHHWRWLLAAAGSVAGVQLLGIFLLPESPRWYIRKNEPLKAENSLRALAGLPKLEEGDNHYDDDDGGSGATPATRKTDKSYRRRLKEAGIRLTMQKMTDEYQKEKQEQQQRVMECQTPETHTGDGDEYVGDVFPNEQVFKENQMYRHESTQTTTVECGSQSTEARNGSSSIEQLSEESDGNESPPSVNGGNSDVKFYVVQSEMKLPELKPRIAEGGKEMNGDQPRDANNSRRNSYYYETFTKCKRHYRQILISVGCAYCQNLTASTAVLYYSTELFQLGGVDNPFLAGTGIGVAKIFGILAVIFFIEKLGRRNFLLIGTFCILLCHLCFAICFSFLQFVHMQLASTLVVIIMFIFMFSQNISWAGLMFVVSSEVLPSSVRGLGMALTITSFWVLAFLTQSTFETLMEVFTIGGVFLFYAGATVLALLFTFFWIPDFSGQTLEEITKIFEERKRRRRTKRMLLKNMSSLS